MDIIQRGRNEPREVEFLKEYNALEFWQWSESNKLAPKANPLSSTAPSGSSGRHHGVFGQIGALEDLEV
jgi:hypothetical protein